MIQSQPVVVQGHVFGVAVSHPAGWHFVAADPRVADLHGQIFASPTEAARVAALVLERDSAVPPTLPVMRPPSTQRHLWPDENRDDSTMQFGEGHS